ncbi:hypothetical protein CTI14_01540 [Methylobacterium radiotolerans]|uniref:hypothetical protein n=1 Tax=Methylobacterium sp. 22177 TaxID=3453885 RepID=UPI000CA8A881|nr:hypothetical protein CTI14_01540 [Methylobacterium radiotolerans]
MARIEELAATLQGLAAPGIKRKELVAAVREKHPKASKKDIVRAAFYALTSAVDGDLERAQRLHTFALHERTAEDEEPLPVKRRKRDRRKDAQRNQQPTH